MNTIDMKVINVDELELEHFKQGSRFEGRAIRVGPLLGARDLGYSYVVVPPGMCACPYHSHRGSEEMFFISSGKGTLRYGNETRALRAGDVICCPSGGQETAHQILNDSDADLAYLCVSTIISVEIVEYHDSKKIGAYAGDWGKDLFHVTRMGSDLDYWADEGEGP
jgi:uncharacterized cupin superfamily protein